MAQRYGMVCHMTKPVKQKKATAKGAPIALKRVNMDQFRVSEPVRKVTLNIPKQLLEEEMEATGLGVTELICAALEKQRRIRRQQALLRLQGNVKFELTYEQIKEMRD